MSFWFNSSCVWIPPTPLLFVRFYLTQISQQCVTKKKYSQWGFTLQWSPCKQRSQKYSSAPGYLIHSVPKYYTELQLMLIRVSHNVLARGSSGDSRGLPKVLCTGQHPGCSRLMWSYGYIYASPSIKSLLDMCKVTETCSYASLRWMPVTFHTNAAKMLYFYENIHWQVSTNDFSMSHVLFL